MSDFEEIEQKSVYLIICEKIWGEVEIVCAFSDEEAAQEYLDGLDFDDCMYYISTIKLN